jgi:hypothetical protein
VVGLDDRHTIFSTVDQGGRSKDSPVVVLACSGSADRRAGEADERSYDLRLSVIMGKQLFAGVSGAITAAVADHDQGLTAFQVRLRSILCCMYAEMKTNAISAIGFYGVQESFQIFYGKPYAQGICHSNALGIIGPSFLFVAADQGIYFLLRGEFCCIYGFFFNCVHGCLF